MEITLLDNREGTVHSAVSEACDGAERGYVAVAYLKGSGLETTTSLEKFVESRRQTHVLAGIDFQLTDLEALDRFDRPPSEARIYVRSEGSEQRSFHPKVYLFESDKRSVAIVGSSNFSRGGLERNVEANLRIEASPVEPIIQAVRAFHGRLWNSGFAVPVTGNFRENYRALQARRREVELALRSEADYTMAGRRLRSAVAEALAAYPERGARPAWLLITSPQNYIRNMEGEMWGDEQRKRIGRVRSGDLIFFYLTGMMALGAMGLVTTDPYEDRTPHWEDGRLYPYRFGFSVLLRPSVQPPFKPLVPELDLFDRSADPNWGQRLQASMRELSPHDTNVLRKALTSALGKRLSA